MMKCIGVFLLPVFVYGQDWTCDDWVEGGAALGAFASSDTAVASQADLLLGELCPQADDPDFCVEIFQNFGACLREKYFLFTSLTFVQTWKSVLNLQSLLS